MKKVFVAAKHPIGAALRAVLEVVNAPIVSPEDADVVMTCTVEETTAALETYPERPIWQIVFMGQGVAHRRVRQFDGLNLMAQLVEALRA